MEMLFIVELHARSLQVERVEVKDVRLPIQLQRAMAAEAEAAREARAKVRRAERHECNDLEVTLINSFCRS